MKTTILKTVMILCVIAFMTSCEDEPQIKTCTCVETWTSSGNSESYSIEIPSNESCASRNETNFVTVTVCTEN